MINARHQHTPSAEDGLWIPEGPGKWSRPLRFLNDNRGWVELMRLAPGTRLGLHRHDGEVHAYNLQGERRLCTGEVVGEGDYVHEFDGNIDWWEAIGDTPLVLFVVVLGTVEYLGMKGEAGRRITTADRIADYLRYCDEVGMVPAVQVQA
ncbi:MAG TPA: cupin domain-containing protein [Stenotrophomonas sp.]|nr:cupin domain-containing protein [Stenotrophomonas sp.]